MISCDTANMSRGLRIIDTFRFGSMKNIVVSMRSVSVVSRARIETGGSSAELEKENVKVAGCSIQAFGDW